MRMREYAQLPVVLWETGELIGHVEWLDYTMGARQLSGIGFRRLGRVRRRGYAAFPDIACLGEHAVVIRQYRPSTDKMPLSRPDYHLYDGDGKFLGDIYDVHLDEKGRVKAWELSKSLVEDIKNGREILTLSGKLLVDCDRVVMTGAKSAEKGEE